MIIEIGGGEGGFKEYMETGQKKGRDLHRDHLDRRIPLFGDLDVFEIATSTHEGVGQRYDHITLSFLENHVSDEMLQIAVDEFREHVLVAWPESERHRVAFYAEAHRPKILSYINSETGEHIERLIHIHIGIGRRDLATGKSIEPLGFLGPGSTNLKYIDAFQESFNSRHGFASPKDNPKITPENAVDTLARYKGTRPNSLGKFNERKAALEVTLQKEILAKNITAWADFSKLLEEHGSVSMMYKGQFNECFRVKPHGSDKAMRLSGIFFKRGFIERPTEEKLSIIADKAKIAYLGQMQPRKAQEYLAVTLDEWRTIKAREHRYLHTGSKFYKEVYKPADAQTRQHLLDQQERKHHVLTSAIHNQTRKTTTPRVRLLGLQVQHLDGIQHRSEMLLRGHTGVHVPTGSEGARDRLGVRQADGSGGNGNAIGSDADNPNASSSNNKSKSEPRRAASASEAGDRGGLHLVQPSSVLARIEADLLDRYEQTADKERYAEIRKNIDCTQLLSRLSHSHGLNPELYRVATAKDGTPRIQCGSRARTPSDFLTKELGLPWKEAAPVLRQVYEHQIGGKVIKPRTLKAAPSRFWTDFKARRVVTGAELIQSLKTFNADAKKRRDDLAAALKAEQKKALSGLSGPALKAEMALVKLHAATAKAELAAALKEERQTLRESIQPPQALAWGLFLQSLAQAGSEEALAALRKLDSSARTAKPSSGITGTIIIEDEKKHRRDRESGASILKNMIHSVALNGDVTYHSKGHAILRDEGQHLAVLDEHSEEAIAAGLLIAREKFGLNLKLTGGADFQRRVVAIAAAQGIAVKFLDPALEEMRLHLIEEKRHAMKSVRTLAREQPEPVPQLIAPSNKPTQQEQAQPAVAEKALALNTKLTPTQEERIMATEQDRKLVQQATAKRKENSHYQPTLVEMKAVDQVLIEQAKKKQQKAAEAPMLAEPGQPSNLDLQAQRAAAPASEKPATEQHQPETIVEPTLQLSAAAWIATQHKPEVPPHQFGDERVEFAVAYLAIDGVVIDHGRTFATYSIRPGTDWHVGQKIVIDKTGSIAVPTGRAGHEVSKGRID